MSRLPSGVLAAVVTPITDALEPDCSAFLAHCRWLLGNGCSGLVVLATAGEANSLSLSQRLAVIEAARGGGLPMDRIIIGGGSSALDEAVVLTRSIVEAGAAGVLLLPPFYYRDPAEEGLFRFHAALIERVGHAALRLVLHHRPQSSGAPITHALITRLRQAFGPVIAGVQNGGGDWATTAALLDAFAGLAIFSGTERYLLETLRAGGQGCISATLNLTAPLAQPIAQRPESAAAETLQQELSEVRAVFDDFPTPAAQKEILARLTGAPIWRNLLPPLLPLNRDQRSALVTRLEALPQLRAVLAAARAA